MDNLRMGDAIKELLTMIRNDAMEDRKEARDNANQALEVDDTTKFVSYRIQVAFYDGVILGLTNALDAEDDLRRELEDNE